MNNPVDGFKRAERSRAFNVYALVIALLDVIFRQFASAPPPPRHTKLSRKTHHPSQSFSSKLCVILSPANPLHWRKGRVPLPTETGEP